MQGEHTYDLPPGYFVRGYGYLLSDPEEPFFRNLYRPDRSPVSSVPIGAWREDVEAVAWRDHRRRTLRIVAGGKG